MTLKTISQIDSPLSDLLIAMTICNTACFDKSQKFDNKIKDVCLNIESINNEKKLFALFLLLLYKFF